MRTYELFFETIRLFLDHGVTHVAEAAFQHAAWARGLEPLYPLAELRIVRCHVDQAVARARPNTPRTGAAQPIRTDDTAHFAIDRPFDPLVLDVPTLDVDTSDADATDIAAVVAFARSSARYQ